MDKVKVTIAAPTVAKCSECGKESEDVNKNPHAWDGWNFWLDGCFCADCFDARESADLQETKALA